MAKAYSLDLRDRVTRFVAAGHSRRATAVHFGVSISFVVRLMVAWRAEGCLHPKPASRRRHVKLDAHADFLLGRCRAEDYITIPNLAAALIAATGTKAAPAAP